MKNLLFSLMAFVLIGFNANAQKITKEEARVYAAKVLINFKGTLQEEFANSKNFDEFVKNATGQYTTTNTPAPQGKALLQVTYNYMKAGTSNADIIKGYSGKEVAAVYKFTQDNPNSLESQVFGFKQSSEPTQEPYPCRWWQVRCHLVQIVGETAADIIITAVIALVL